MSGVEGSDEAVGPGRRASDVEAGAYWQRLAGQVDASQAAGPHRGPEMPDLPKQTDPPENLDITDPTVAIVQTLLDNVAITKELKDESEAARRAMADSMRKTALQADAMSADMRSLTIALQRLAEQQPAKWDRYIWAGIGFVLGVVVTDASFTTFPALWHQLFG